MNLWTLDEDGGGVHHVQFRNESCLLSNKADESVAWLQVRVE